MKKRKNFAVLVVRSLLLLSQVAKDSFEKTGFACVPPGVVVIIKNHFPLLQGLGFPQCICMLRPVNITRLLDLSVCCTWFPTIADTIRLRECKPLQFHFLSNSLDEHEKIEMFCLLARSAHPLICQKQLFSAICLAFMMIL